MNNIKKFILSSGVIVIFVLYAIRLKFGDDEGSRTITPNVVSNNVQTEILPTSTPIATLTPSGKYKDGTYTGAVADAFYGNIQVQSVISGGKISDVIFLQYPNDRGTSIEINTQAMPILKTEAIAVQSAKVDGASGATQTSRAFIESMQNALDQAI